MRFIRLLTAATAVLSVFASPVGQDANPDTKGLSTDTQQGLSATQVCDTINGFTTMSQDLRVRFESVTILNVILVGDGLVDGLRGIVNGVITATITINANQGKRFNDHDARLIVQALTTFVQVHQQLLDVIIGKHGLMAFFFFAEPLRVVLVALEQVVDACALGIIHMIPTQKSVATSQITSLDIKIQDTITVYS